MKNEEVDGAAGVVWQFFMNEQTQTFNSHYFKHAGCECFMLKDSGWSIIFKVIPHGIIMLTQYKNQPILRPVIKS